MPDSSAPTEEAAMEAVDTVVAPTAVVVDGREDTAVAVDGEEDTVEAAGGREDTAEVTAAALEDGREDTVVDTAAVDTGVVTVVDGTPGRAEAAIAAVATAVDGAHLTPLDGAHLTPPDGRVEAAMVVDTAAVTEAVAGGKIISTSPKIFSNMPFLMYIFL